MAVGRRTRCRCGECYRCRARIKSANQRARQRGDLEAIQILPPWTGAPAELPLKKLRPGPFISRGGFLDYAPWDDRDRFVELDRLISRKHLPAPLIRARNLRILAAFDRGIPVGAIAAFEGISREMVRKVKQLRERFPGSVSTNL